MENQRGENGWRNSELYVMEAIRRIEKQVERLSEQVHENAEASANFQGLVLEALRNHRTRQAGFITLIAAVCSAIFAAVARFFIG